MRIPWPQRGEASDMFPLDLSEEQLRSDDDLSFVDDTLSDWGGQLASSGEKNQRLRSSVGVRRLMPVRVFLFLGLAAVLVRCMQVQLVQQGTYVELAEGNRSRIERVAAERGVIIDRNGVVLAKNVPKFTVTVTPADLPADDVSRREVLAELAELVDLVPRDIEAVLEEAGPNGTRAVPVADDIGHEQAILAEILSSRWTGVQLLRGTKREYPLSVETASLSHVIGFESGVTEDDLSTGDFLTTDRVGRTGLERVYDGELRGVYGRRRVEVDALGRRKTTVAEEASVSGQNLELTLDADLQQVAERALRDSLRLTGTSRGSVIALRPDNGEVLALVSWPAYDNNLFAAGISQVEYSALLNDADNPLFDRAIGASLPSGSVFKPVVAAAALAEGIVTPKTTFNSVGGLSVSRWFFPDWKAGGHGLTNLAKAISESVNTYFYIIGGGYDDREGLGVQRIVDYARRFGFGSPTGIDLPGEGAGFLPSEGWKEETKDEVWYIGDTYHLAIGQGDLLVTPLQIAVMTAEVANGGHSVQPYVVSSVFLPDERKESVAPEPMGETVLSDEFLGPVRQGMRDSVLYGSSRGLSLLPFTSAGKTGTAQWSSQHDNHAWFTSFAPFEKPEIVVTVMVEEGGEGSRAAVPVAREVLRRYFEKSSVSVPN